MTNQEIIAKLKDIIEEVEKSPTAYRNIDDMVEARFEDWDYRAYTYQAILNAVLDNPDGQEMLIDALKFVIIMMDETKVG